MIRRATFSQHHRFSTAPRPCRGRAQRWARHGLKALVAFLLFASSASAQSFGQWWWQGYIQLDERQTENQRDGDVLGDQDEQNLTLSLELNGYLGHPALGNFRLGADLTLSELASVDTNDLGASSFHFNLTGLPLSAAPFNLFYSHGKWNYGNGGTDEEEPSLFRGSPDTVTTWGGNVRITKGTLRGLLLGLNRSVLEQLDPELRDETNEREYLDWSRAGRKLNHHLRIERRSEQYAFDLGFEDVLLRLDQQGNLTDKWRWQLSATGQQRGMTFGDNPESDSEAYRVSTQATRALRHGNALDVTTSLVRSRAGNGPFSEGSSLGSSYYWRPSPAWQVSPSVNHSRQTSPRSSANGTGGGLSVSWSGKRGPFTVLASGRASHSRLEREALNLPSVRTRQSAYSFTSTLRFGGRRGLRGNLTLGLNRGEFTAVREPIPELPDLGLSDNELSIQDSAHLRFGINRRWGRRFVNAWTEWSGQQVDASAMQRGSETERLTASLQITDRTLSFRVNASDTTVDRPTKGEEAVRSLTASAAWHPRGYFGVSSSHRRDSRQVFLVPDLEGAHTEVGLDFALGLLSLQVFAFETRESVAHLEERTSRGLRWTVRRGFAGWLPIVTGTQRRGTIR
jgi:hypothetical protein